MNEPFQSAQAEKLLAIAAAKLGTTPAGLRAAFEQGGLQGVTAALSPQQAQKAKALASDGQVEQLLADPAIQRLLIQLLGQ